MAAAAVVAVIAAATAWAGGTSPAAANADGSYVTVYNPIIDGDSVHNDVSAWWPWGYDTSPAGHRIVYSNWGYANDLSMDVFAKASGKTIVTPFGSRTNTGHAVQSKIVNIRLGCASGSYADGGYVVTVEARDMATGEILGRSDLMHVASPQVRVGQVLGGWTPIGFTNQFRYSSCHQVTSASGVHVHMELTNYHRYACYFGYGYNQALTELTALGRVGAHYGGPRARC